MARTKWRIKGSPLPPPLLPNPTFRTRETLHMLRSFSGAQNSGDNPGHKECCPSQKPSLWDPSWLRGAGASKAESQGRLGWIKRPNNWLKVNKDQGELTHIDHLTASLLCSFSLGGCPHHLSPAVHLCLASILAKKAFLYVFLHLLLSYVSNYKLCTCIYRWSSGSQNSKLIYWAKYKMSGKSGIHVDQGKRSCLPRLFSRGTLIPCLMVLPHLQSQQCSILKSLTPIFLPLSSTFRSPL